MSSKDSIVFLNKRGEFEEYDILGFAQFVVRKFILTKAFLEDERDDLVQDACLYILSHREEIEKRRTNYAYVCIYHNVFDSARNRLRFNRKTKVIAATDDDACIEGRV